MTPKTVLVTGPAGFIGSNFVTQFKAQFPDTAVIGIDDFSTGRREALQSGMIFYEGSICNRQLLEEIFTKHKPEFVFHFAALPRVSLSVQEPARTTEVNVYGAVLVLELAKKHNVTRVILSSSSSVYGGADNLPTNEKDNRPRPVSPYALQKYADELFAQMFGQLYGLDTVCLRYFNVFGPGQYGDSAYSTVISAWLEGLYFPTDKQPFLEGDGSQSRDFCYVDNVVQANIKAMLADKKFNGEVFNVAHGERTDLRTVKQLIEQHTNRQIKLEVRPPRLGDVLHTHADTEKAHQWFDYTPEINFEAGLKKTIAWFESRAKQSKFQTK